MNSTGSSSTNRRGDLVIFRAAVGLLFASVSLALGVGLGRAADPSAGLMALGGAWAVGGASILYALPLVKDRLNALYGRERDAP